MARGNRVYKVSLGNVERRLERVMSDITRSSRLSRRATFQWRATFSVEGGRGHMALEESYTGTRSTTTSTGEQVLLFVFL